MSMKLRDMPFEERINSTELAPLAPAFVKFVKSAAKANNKTPNDIWLMWQGYTNDCRGYDQSPAISEFLAWYKLEK